jgi:hypothetical protein
MRIKKFLLIIALSSLLFSNAYGFQKQFSTSNSNSKLIKAEAKVGNHEPKKQAIRAEAKQTIQALFIGCNGFF